MPRLLIRPLDASRAADFRSVMGRANPEARKCLCTAAYVEPPRAASCRDRMLASGESDGFLFYRDGQPVGWCQVAPRASFPVLVRGRNLSRDAGVWAISCLVLVPEAKGSGLSHRLLSSVLDELRRRNVRRVQVFACRYGPDEDTSTFIEFPESLCVKAGMALEHDHPMRPIYGLTLGR